MVQAIGSSALSHGFGPRTSAATLEAQLNRYEIQLADWCHCGSAKTPEGKAKIQEITDKADAVKAQLEKINQAKPAQQAAPLYADANRGAGTGGDAIAPRIFDRAGVVPRVANAPTGSLVNVFA